MHVAVPILEHKIANPRTTCSTCQREIRMGAIVNGVPEYEGGCDHIAGILPHGRAWIIAYAASE